MSSIKSGFVTAYSAKVGVFFRLFSLSNIRYYCINNIVNSYLCIFNMYERLAMQFIHFLVVELGKTYLIIKFWNLTWSWILEFSKKTTKKVFSLLFFSHSSANFWASRSVLKRKKIHFDQHKIFIHFKNKNYDFFKFHNKTWSNAH